MAQQPGQGPVYQGQQYGGSARPGGVTAAAVLLIILGALYSVIGAIILFTIGSITGSSGAFASLAGMAIVMVLVVLAFGVLQIVAGVKVLGLKSGGRILGIVLASIGGIFSLIGVIQSFNAQTVSIDANFQATTSSGLNPGSLAIGLLFLAANVIVVIQLAKNGEAFGAPGGQAYAAAPPPPPPA